MTIIVIVMEESPKKKKRDYAKYFHTYYYNHHAEMMTYKHKTNKIYYERIKQRYKCVKCIYLYHHLI